MHFLLRRLQATGSGISIAIACIIFIKKRFYHLRAAAMPPAERLLSYVYLVYSAASSSSAPGWDAFHDA